MYLVKNTGKFTVYLEREIDKEVELVAIMKPGDEKCVFSTTGLRVNQHAFGLGKAEYVEVNGMSFRKLLTIQEVDGVINEK